MIKTLNKYYQTFQQKLSCAAGLTYTEEHLEDTHNSGGIDRIVQSYCAVSGKLIEEKIHLSPQAKKLALEDITK